MTYALSAVGFITSLIAALIVLVHLIDRLDKWGRRNHPSLRIVVPEQRDPSNVVVLADRRAS